jgi:hypothetical protein
MANTVFGRLSFDFDSTKFGDTINLSDDAKNSLTNYSKIDGPDDWMITDMANGPIDSTSYYRNPVLNVSNDIISSMTTLAVTANSQQGRKIVFASSEIANNLTKTAAAARIAEMNRFISHTANVSGTAANVFQDPNIPTQDSITALGNQMIVLLNQTDGIQNTVGALGAMTSLFIESDLKANNDVISLFNQEILDNTIYVPGLPGANTCQLSNTRLQQMVDSLDSVYNFVYTRRTEDWHFFSESFRVATENAFLHRFSKGSMSSTQTILINDYIGSDKLKAKLASTNT